MEAVEVQVRCQNRETDWNRNAMSSSPCWKLLQTIFHCARAALAGSAGQWVELCGTVTGV